MICARYLHANCTLHGSMGLVLPPHGWSVKKIPARKMTPKFMPIFTRGRHMSLSRTKLIGQPSALLSLFRSVLIHYYPVVRLPTGLFRLGVLAEMMYCLYNTATCVVRAPISSSWVWPFDITKIRALTNWRSQAPAFLPPEFPRKIK